MSDLRKAAEMALEALENTARSAVEQYVIEQHAVEALRQALAQPEQEPVAWWDGDAENVLGISKTKELPDWEPLYAKPPKPEQETWTPVEIGVDVTPEGAHVVGMYVLMPEAVRHVFYSQFHSAPPSKSEKEPYGYVWTSVRDGMEVRFSRMPPNDFYKPQDIKPVYTAPPSKPWVSLTDEDMCEAFTPGDSYADYARAIEAALRSKNT